MDFRCHSESLKLDRLGRNLHHLINTVHELTDSGIGLRVLTGRGAAIDADDWGWIIGKDSGQRRHVAHVVAHRVGEIADRLLALGD